MCQILGGGDFFMIPIIPEQIQASWCLSLILNPVGSVLFSKILQSLTEAITPVICISTFTRTVLNVLNLGNRRKFPFREGLQQEGILLPLATATLYLLLKYRRSRNCSPHPRLLEYSCLLGIPDLAVDFAPSFLVPCFSSLPSSRQRGPQVCVQNRVNPLFNLPTPKSPSTAPPPGHSLEAYYLRLTVVSFSKSTRVNKTIFTKLGCFI